jgi:hypothetical protein
MAEIFPDEGLDYCLGVVFDALAQDTTFFVGLFTSQTASTCPARTATGGAAPSGFTEITASSGTYARQAISAGAWGALSTVGNGRRFSAPQVTFTGFVGAAAANGFFISTLVASGAGDIILCFANFDSAVARTFAVVADQLLLTPSVQFDG